MEQLPLKDIHLPTVIGFWPPAAGWWLLLAGMGLLLCLAYWLIRRLRRRSAFKAASKILMDLRGKKQEDRLATLTELSALLRRVAISAAPRTDVASLNGAAWLAYLDQGLDDQPFSNGAGRCLAQAPYRPMPPTAAELEALLSLCERWLKQQAKKR